MKKLKKVLVAVLAGTMVLSSMAVAAFADDEVKFTEVTYNFTVTEFVEAETVTIGAQTSDWVGVESTFDITGEGAVSATLQWKAEDGNIMEESAFTNMGYLSGKVANILSLDSVVINGVSFEFQADASANEGKDAVFQTSAINPSDGTLNGFPNIWNAAGQQAVVAKSANGSTINGGTDAITITWADADLAADTETGDSASTALVLVAVAALAVVATVSVKKYAVER